MFTNAIKTLKPAAFFGKRQKLFCILLVVISNVMCSTSAQQDTNQPLKETVHSTGIILRLPDTFEVKQFDGFLMVRPPPENRRGREPKEIKIRLLTEPPPAEVSSWKTRQIGNRVVQYQIQQGEEGYGNGAGIEYILTAYEKTSNNNIFYDYWTQTAKPDDDPDYKFGWQVIEATSIKP